MDIRRSRAGGSQGVHHVADASEIPRLPPAGAFDVVLFNGVHGLGG